jgi:DNA invertase Pin-like site-specific DNA recombinase
LPLPAGRDHRKAGFRSLADARADTTTAHGRLMLTVLGGLANDAVSAVMRSSAARTQELPGLLGVRCYA